MMKWKALRYFYSDPANIPSKTFDFGNYNLYLKYGDDWRAKRTAAIHRRMRSWGLNTIAASEPSIAKAGESRMPYTVWMPARSRKIETVQAHWGALLDPFAPEFQENARNKALEKGILKRADENAELVVKNFVMSAAGTEYHVILERRP